LYATVPIIIRDPFVTASVSQGTVQQGNNLFVRGVAEGDPSQGVVIWVIGQNFIAYNTEAVNDDGTFEYEVDGGMTSGMTSGQYFVVVQHPMYNDELDVYPQANGGYTYRYVVGPYPTANSVLFTLEGPGSLQGSEAVNALTTALDNSAVDDTYVKLEFLVEGEFEAPIANFTANVTSGITPLTVVFTDASTGTAPLTYAWDLDNNGVIDSTYPNPVVHYTSPGKYTVNLTVTNEAGSDTEVKVDYINVTLGPPVADFSTNTTSGVAPLTVAFTDESTGYLDSWAWDFDNNGAIDSTDEDPLFTYPTSGTYTVNLTVTGPGGVDSQVKTNYITVTEAPVAPVAAFSANTTSGVAPLTVAFMDASTGTEPLTYKWDFTNDGSIDSTTKNPTFTYTSVGTYTVNHTVTGPGGSDSDVKTNYITVNAVPTAPTAQFTANTTSGTAPLTVQFTEQSLGYPISSWAWDFGDSANSTLQNPVHTYTNYGTYNVSLTVTNAAGEDTIVKNDYIQVIPMVGGDKGYYLIHCNVEGAKVYFDEDYKGDIINGTLLVKIYLTATPYHRYSVSKAGYVTVNEALPTYPAKDETKDIFVTLVDVTDGSWTRPPYPEVTRIQPGYPDSNWTRPPYPEVTRIQPGYPDSNWTRPPYPEVTRIQPGYPDSNWTRPAYLDWIWNRSSFHNFFKEMFDLQ